MNQEHPFRLTRAIGICLLLIACNPGTQSTTTTTTSTDSTDSTHGRTTTTQAVPAKPAPDAIDAVQAAPNLYKVLADSAGIRVIDAVYKPGDSSAMHSHPDNAIYVARGGTATFTLKDGTTAVNDMKTGMVAIQPAQSHSVKNTGKTTLEVILVEVNRPNSPQPADTTMDAAKVAKDLYKVKADSMGLRILQINYRPGQSSAMHAHPDAALYIIEGGTSEFTNKDGSKQTYQLKSGMAMISPAGVHSVKNVGKTTTRAILVEVNRPKQ